MSPIDLSVLVCSVHTRYDSFLPKIQKQLYDQLAELSEKDQERVEIMVLTDNKQMMLGAKRNHMVDMAQGKYIAFVDDDDRIAPDYLSELLKATESGADCIAFTAMVSLNGEPPLPCYYSKDNGADFNKKGAYYRIPNHICCVRKDVSVKSSFPNIKYGEDAGYSKILLPHLKTEHKIDKVLYYYDYNSHTTETQKDRINVVKPKSGEPIVDVIILSRADSIEQRIMTQRAVDSCNIGANGLPVNIIVLEQKDAMYANAVTLKMESDFHYNRYGNYGASRGHAKWIMLANNDLEFQNGWLHTLLAAGHQLVSPVDPNNPRQRDIEGNEVGEQNGRNLSGWCFMIERALWDEIGGFDEDVDFWCSDDVVIEQCKAKGVLPMVVGGSRVLHLGSQTHNAIDFREIDDRKWGNVYLFNKKYGKDKFADRPEYQAYLERKGLK